MLFVIIIRLSKLSIVHGVLTIMLIPKLTIDIRNWSQDNL